MKTSLAIDEFIAGRGNKASEQPTHHRHIITLFGLYARPAGKAITVATIVRLMAELDAEPSSVRSSISRLKKKGVLVSEKTKVGNSYALFADLEPHMQAGDERIYSAYCATMADPWLLVSFSVPESERKNRHKIRTGLARMGFGAVTAGLYIAPARLQDEVTEYIREHELWGYVDLFVCESSLYMDIEKKVSQWWNLDSLAAEYQGFIDSYQPIISQWQDTVRTGKATPQAAFKLYIPMMTQWRRLPFLDPGLPPELLPKHWAGTAARHLFNDLDQQLRSLSKQYVDLR